MDAAMQLYAGFALLMIAIVAIIAVAALVSTLIGSLRWRFGRARAHDDFSDTAPPARHVPSASPTATPAARSADSDRPPNSR
ncbi:MAG TPA: hypothetical protein VNE82_17165 [Candidatus Binataceae bacterium]|nr:hypothetical protein [Candidatus Binataceae bacterium]